MTTSVLSMEEQALETRVEYISPAVARALLEHNEGNRPVNWNYVHRLARIMALGKFRLNPQPIIQDVGGRLVDGQQRLYAVIEAGVGVPMNVTRNAPTDISRVIDENRKRSWHDRATTLHPEWGLSRKAVGTLKAMIQGGRNRQMSLLTFDDVEDSFDLYREGLAFAMEVCPDDERRAPGIATAAMRAALARAFYYAKDKPEGLDAIRAFYQKVATGVGICEGETYLSSLSQQIIRHTTDPRVRWSTLFLYRVISRALRAFIDGHPVKQLKAATGELFPIPEEPSEMELRVTGQAL